MSARQTKRERALTTYLRKAWVPLTCAHCGQPAPPWQGRTPLWSGSRPWLRGTHFSCLLRIHYGGIAPDVLAPPFYRALTANRDDWRGGTFVIPIKTASKS